MTQDEIISMARKAGLGQSGVSMYVMLNTFADLVSQRQRKEDAKVCLEISKDKWNEYKGLEPYTKNNPNCANPHTVGMSDGAQDCAHAILNPENQHE